MHKETLTLDNKVSQPFIETSSSDLVYLHIVRSLHKIPTSLLCPCLFCHIRSKFPYLYSLFLSLHILIYLKFLYHTCGVEIIYGSYNGSILLTSIWNFLCITHYFQFAQFTTLFISNQTTKQRTINKSSYMYFSRKVAAFFIRAHC